MSYLGVRNEITHLECLPTPPPSSSLVQSRAVRNAWDQCWTVMYCLYWTSTLFALVGAAPPCSSVSTCYLYFWVCSGHPVWVTVPRSTDRPFCVFLRLLTVKLCTQNIVSVLPYLTTGPPEPLSCRLPDAGSIHSVHQPHTASLWAALPSHPTRGVQADFLQSLLPPRCQSGPGWGTHLRLREYCALK